MSRALAIGLLALALPALAQDTGEAPTTPTPDRDEPETPDQDEPEKPDQDVTPPPGTFVPEPGLREGLYEPDEPPVQAPDLEKRRSSRRIYPRKLSMDMSEPLQCDVVAVLDDKGRPTEIRPDGCVDEPLYEHTVKRVMKDRWVKPTPMGAEIPVSVTYIPPVDAMQLPQTPYWRRRMQTVCRAHLEIARDGSVTIEREQGDCGLQAVPVPPTPEDLPKGRTPEVCELTFMAKPSGEAVQIERFRCGLRLWKHALAVLDAVTWTQAPDHPGGPQPWSVLLQFDK